MINVTINGSNIPVEEGSTILQVANFIGIHIPTLCYLESLTAYGACRLCVVEIGEDKNTKLVSACTYPVIDGLKVRTDSSRIIQARRVILELLLASCPLSKTIQDLALTNDVRQQRFKQEYEDCILCGLCVRMCKEQMMARAIGYRGRGETKSIGTPFDIKSDQCRLCGGCIYVCPVCQVGEI